MAQEVDEIAVRELILFIENDGQLYQQQTVPIEKNLYRKKKKGTYDHRKAPKLWGYLVESGAKKYVKDLYLGDAWYTIFPPDVRRAAAKEMADDWLSNYKSGYYDHLD
jgi:hypothetical protein